MTCCDRADWNEEATPCAISPPPCPGEALGAAEADLLAELGREGDATVAFQGLRRRLALHQETLTRSLQRLVDAGLVARQPDGYALTEAGEACLRYVDVPPTGDTRPIVQALLPPTVHPDHVARDLTGRWWQSLRWYGSSGGPGEVVLTWVTDPEGQVVRLRLAGAAATVEAEASPDADRTYEAAAPLVQALADVYRRGGAS